MLTIEALGTTVPIPCPRHPLDALEKRRDIYKRRGWATFHCGACQAFIGHGPVDGAILTRDMEGEK